MDQRARRAREREQRRLLDLAVESGFDRDLAASCLARLLEVYGTYLLGRLRRRRGFPSSLSGRLAGPAGLVWPLDWQSLTSAVLGRLVLC
jgi:hypothetical protein